MSKLCPAADNSHSSWPYKDKEEDFWPIPEEESGRIIGTNLRDDCWKDGEDPLNEGADEIDRLYKKLSYLNARLERTPDDFVIKQEISTSFTRLRELQEEEASKLGEAFERSLSITSEAALRVMSEATELLKRYEDSSTSARTSQRADDS